jgi:hypothetical protein
MTEKHLSLHKALEKFLKLDDFKDFTIKVGSNDFQVHKFVFAARSESFADMLKFNPSATELIIEDISEEVFESILKFVYTDEEPQSPLLAREILLASKKLKIEGLKEICEEILLNEMENEENLDILMENHALGFLGESEKLKFEAFRKIQKHFEGHRLKDQLLNDPVTVQEIIKAKKLLDENTEKDYKEVFY